MRPLSASDVLWVVEQGAGLDATGRALTILAAAGFRSTWQELLELPLGEREHGLLALRAATLGPELSCQVACTVCGETQEFALNSTDLLEVRPAPEVALGEPVRVAPGERELWFRLPNSADLIAVAREHSTQRAAERLVLGCLVRAERAGEAVVISALEPEVVEAAGRALEAADPRAETRVRTHCAACDQDFAVVLEMGAFFWEELLAQARLVVAEVARLARAYGWSERDILAMAPSRRRLYLEQVGA